MFICTAKWANIYIASSLEEHGKLKNIISMSEVGRERPTAFEPNSKACDVWKIEFTKNLTLSKATIL